MILNTKKRTLMGKLVALAGGIAVVGAIALVPAGAAMANGNGCALSHGSGGTTCLAVVGNNTTVTSVRVSHGDGFFVNYCGFQSRFSGTKQASGAFSTTFGYTSGCTAAPYYNDATINGLFVRGTNVSGTSYHDGAWAPGVPTVAIQ